MHSAEGDHHCNQHEELFLVLKNVIKDAILNNTLIKHRVDSEIERKKTKIKLCVY